MSDTPQKPEQGAEGDQSNDKIVDLPNKQVTDRDARSVKGGEASISIRKGGKGTEN